MKQRITVTRRDFLRGTAGLVMAMGLGAPTLSEAGAEERARVVLDPAPQGTGVGWPGGRNHPAAHAR